MYHSRIKLLLTAAIASVSFAGVASAADLPVKALPAPVPVFTWTGCYIGANVGGKWASTTERVNIAPSTGVAGAVAGSFNDFGRSSDDTVIGGGQVGCNWQTGQWVFGVEGDADAQRWRRTSVIPNVAGLPLSFVAGDTFELRSDWQASIRGRIGYAWDRNLFYVTGGVAFTDVTANTNWIQTVAGGTVFPQVLTSQTKNLAGGTIGAGYEHAFTNNFTVGIEGRYTWYGHETFDAGLLPVAALRGQFTNAVTTRDVNVETAEVMLKANWLFSAGR